MTDSLFFDTDCISAFLWVGNESLLPKLYPGRIVIPAPVYAELSNPGIAHLKARVDAMVSAGQAEISDIMVETEEYEVFYKLTAELDKGRKLIGKGEAASIALAKKHDGIVASNNLRDIDDYIKEFQLQHMTTGDILIEACKRGFITEAEGNTIWAFMLAKRRRLGAASFSDFLRSKGCFFTKI